jgi:hypothetical protein
MFRYRHHRHPLLFWLGTFWFLSRILRRRGWHGGPYRRGPYYF